MIRPFCKYTKRNPFVPSFYLKNYETIPIVVISILDVCWLSFCSIRTLFNTDCIITRNTKTPGERTDLLMNPRSRKLIHISQVYEPNEELHELYEDMKQGEEELKKKQQETPE